AGAAASGLWLTPVLLRCRDEDGSRRPVASVDQPRGVARIAVVVVHPRVTRQPPCIVTAGRTKWFRHANTGCAKADPRHGRGSPPKCRPQWPKRDRSSV